MASLRKRGKVYYFRFTDSDGIKRERKACSDKRESEGMAAAAEAEAAKIRGGYIDPKAPRYLAHEGRPLTEHVNDFKTMLLAKGGTRRHAEVSASRATRIIELAKARRISDLSLSKTLDALAVLRAEGLAAETLNHHVRAVKAFSRWLWRDGRAREHHLAHLATSNPESDRRRRRRALTHEEAARLVEAARQGPAAMGLSGPDRSVLYALALGTGFRADELATITPERFDLASRQPTATVEACYAKNGREAVQPLPQSLADRLRPWLASKAPGRPVFDGMTKRTADMIRIDLEVAGVPYETGSGIVDFHALRGTYISHLVSSGASVKTCQTLARHSTPSLTIGLYAKASLHDIEGAMGALPDLVGDRPEPEKLAATGTDVQSIKNPRAHYLPTVGDGLSRDASGSDAMALLDVQSNMEPAPSVLRVPSAPVGLSQSTGGGIRTHTPLPRERILSPLASSPNASKSKGLRLSPESAAHHLPADTRQSEPTDTDLATIVDAWPDLPEAIRSGILAMVKACKGGGV